MLHLIPIGSLVVAVINETEHCGVVSEFDNEIGGGGKAVICVQRIEQGAQHTPLGGSVFMKRVEGGVLVHFDPLRAIC